MQQYNRIPLNPFAFVANSLWILETWHNCQREALEHKATLFFRLETICAKIKWKQKETTTTTTKKYIWITNIYSGSSMISSFRYFSKADQCSNTSNCKMENLKSDGFGKRKLLSTCFLLKFIFCELENILSIYRPSRANSPFHMKHLPKTQIS